MGREACGHIKVGPEHTVPSTQVSRQPDLGNLVDRHGGDDPCDAEGRGSNPEATTT